MYFLFFLLHCPRSCGNSVVSCISVSQVYDLRRHFVLPIFLLHCPHSCGNSDVPCICIPSPYPCFIGNIIISSVICWNCFKSLTLSTPIGLGRMKTHPCGSMDLAPEHCRLFHPAPIIASRDRVNSSLLLHTAKLSSLHRITQVLGTQISTTPRPEFRLNISSSKTLEMYTLPALKPKPLSSRSSYGKTATNLISIITSWFFRVL